MKLFSKTGINTKIKGFCHPPFRLILSPSRCRSSRWPRRWTGTGPSPSSESPCDQCLRKSSAPVSCRDRKANTEMMHHFQNSDVSPKRSKALWANSLPELHDGRRCISVDCFVDRRVPPLKFHTVFWEGERKSQKVLKCATQMGRTSAMFRSITCVPGVVAGWPGQVPGEGERQVEDPPGKNNDVIEIQQGHNHLGPITKTCRDDISVHNTRPPLTSLHLNVVCAASRSCSCPVLPSNKGLIFLQQVMPPSLVYWPRATSRKKTGTPQVNRKIR